MVIYINKKLIYLQDLIEQNLVIFKGRNVALSATFCMVTLDDLEKTYFHDEEETFYSSPNGIKMFEQAVDTLKEKYEVMEHLGPSVSFIFSRHVQMAS